MTRSKGHGVFGSADSVEDWVVHQPDPVRVLDALLQVYSETPGVSFGQLPRMRALLAGLSSGSANCRGASQLLRDVQNWDLSQSVNMAALNVALAVHDAVCDHESFEGKWTRSRRVAIAVWIRASLGHFESHVGQGRALAAAERWVSLCSDQSRLGRLPNPPTMPLPIAHTVVGMLAKTKSGKPRVRVTRGEMSKVIAIATAQRQKAGLLKKGTRELTSKGRAWVRRFDATHEASALEVLRRYEELVEATGKKATGKKATGKKATGKKATGKKATGKKATGKKATGKKATGKKATGSPEKRARELALQKAKARAATAAESLRKASKYKARPQTAAERKAWARAVSEDVEARRALAWAEAGLAATKSPSLRSGRSAGGAS